MRNLFVFLLASALLCCAGACRKTSADAQPTQLTLADSSLVALSTDTTGSSLQAPYPQKPSTNCFATPLYGDSVIYLQPTGGSDYIVKPSYDPGAGHYLSWPGGLWIDSSTGAINISKSQTGERYAIGYVKNGTRDTCLSTLIIGGADYADSIYVMSNGSLVAVPYFNANVYQPSDCSGNGNPCSFDETNSAKDQGVIVDKHTGNIDLFQTLYGHGGHPGVFGYIPLNGTSVTAAIYYKLKKGSNESLQRIDINLMYYDSKSQIDAGVLAAVQSRLTNILNVTLVSLGHSPRPPLVVIVRRP